MSVALSRVLILASLLGLAACGEGEHEDVKQWMAESSRDLRGGVPPLPELQIPPIVSYDPAGNHDPFSPARIEPEKVESGGKQPDFNRTREPLEAYPLETLSFRGLVTKTKDRQPHGLIMADNVMYQVVIGNYLGENFGRIVQIDDAEIKLIETVQDPSGQTRDWVERESTLRLQESASGKEAGK